MNGLSVSAPYTNIHSSGTLSPEFESLLSNCPQALGHATQIIGMAKMNAGAFREEILGNYDTRVDAANTFDPDTRTNRLAQVLLSTLLSYQGVQSNLDNYCTDPNPGFIMNTLSAGSYVVSTAFSPLTRLASWILSFVKDPAPDLIDCNSSPTTIDREAFTFCGAARAFFAETEVNKLKDRCKTVLKAGIEPVASKYMENLGTFLLAAEKGNVNLSFNPANVRKDWDNRFKGTFCDSNPSSTFCTDAAPKHPSNVGEWQKTVLGIISQRIPSKVLDEIQEALIPPTETNIQLDLEGREDL